MPDLLMDSSICIFKITHICQQEYKTHKESFVKRFELTRLPPYLILYIKVSGSALSLSLPLPLSHLIHKVEAMEMLIKLQSLVYNVCAVLTAVTGLGNPI